MICIVVYIIRGEELMGTDRDDLVKSVEEFVLGIEDKFELKEGNDIVVVGKVRGTVNVGDAVYLTNPGDDGAEKYISIVKNIEIGPNMSAAQASDCQVGILLQDAGDKNIKPGTVVYTKNTPFSEVQQAFMSVLGDVYISKKKMVLTDEEIENFSIAECQELWSMYFWYKQKVEPVKSEEEKKECQAKIELLANAMCKKILVADKIYAVYSKATNEPYMFSRVGAQPGGGYKCSPPTIMVIPEAYEDLMKIRFPEDTFYLKAIENDEKKEAIKDFFGTCTFLNGACGVAVNNEQTAVSSDLLVEKPDFSGVNEASIPITNPDLMRWVLLISQIGTPDGKDSEIIYNLYFNFLSKELLKAKFLVPMKHKGDIPSPDAKGETTLKEGVQISFPTVEGKFGRKAVGVYTDWRQLRLAMGDDWEGFIQPIEGMIGQFDCIINFSEHSEMGIYIGEEIFNTIKNN